jgi:hypothetical protein
MCTVNKGPRSVAGERWRLVLGCPSAVLALGLESRLHQSLMLSSDYPINQSALRRRATRWYLQPQLHLNTTQYKTSRVALPSKVPCLLSLCLEVMSLRWTPTIIAKVRAAMGMCHRQRPDSGRDISETARGWPNRLLVPLEASETWN